MGGSQGAHPACLFLGLTVLVTAAATVLLCTAMLTNHWEIVSFNRERLENLVARRNATYALTWLFDGKVAKITHRNSSRPRSSKILRDTRNEDSNVVLRSVSIRDLSQVVGPSLSAEGVQQQRFTNQYLITRPRLHPVSSGGSIPPVKLTSTLYDLSVQGRRLSSTDFHGEEQRYFIRDRIDNLVADDEFIQETRSAVQDGRLGSLVDDRRVRLKKIRSSDYTTNHLRSESIDAKEFSRSRDIEPASTMDYTKIILDPLLHLHKAMTRRKNLSSSQKLFEPLAIQRERRIHELQAIAQDHRGLDFGVKSNEETVNDSHNFDADDSPEEDDQEGSAEGYFHEPYKVTGKMEGDLTSGDSAGENCEGYWCASENLKRALKPRETGRNKRDVVRPDESFYDLNENYLSEPEIVQISDTERSSIVTKKLSSSVNRNSEKNTKSDLMKRLFAQSEGYELNTTDHHRTSTPEVNIQTPNSSTIKEDTVTNTFTKSNQGEKIAVANPTGANLAVESRTVPVIQVTTPHIGNDSKGQQELGFHSANQRNGTDHLSENQQITTRPTAFNFNQQQPGPSFQRLKYLRRHSPKNGRTRGTVEHDSYLRRRKLWKRETQTVAQEGPQPMFLTPMHGGIWTLCVDLPGEPADTQQTVAPSEGRSSKYVTHPIRVEEQQTELALEGFGLAGCINYLGPPDLSEAQKSDWIQRMQNLSISCALVCCIILAASALVGAFGISTRQISAVLVTGVMYILATIFALFCLSIMHFKRRTKKDCANFDPQVAAVFNTARVFTTGWSLRLGWGGALTCLSAALLWLLLARIMRYNPISIT